MFVTSRRQLPLATRVIFEFKLDDGLIALRGTAEVVRHELRGMGMRFVALDEQAKELVARLVSAAAPNPSPTAVEYSHGAVRIRLSAATARFFTYNPLLHVGVGGCFLPADGNATLGTGYDLTVLGGGVCGVEDHGAALLELVRRVGELENVGGPRVVARSKSVRSQG